jgi:hypothetical protein
MNSCLVGYSRDCPLVHLPLVHLLEQSPAQSNQTRGKAIGLQQVLIFVPLDHELMHHDDITFWEYIDRLKTQIHDGMPMLIDMHEPASTGYAIHPLAGGRAYDIKVSAVSDLLVLLGGQHLTHQSVSPALGRKVSAYEQAPFTPVATN